jgi:hypothetical protein
MSHRPINMKKANKLRKLMRERLPAYLDLVQYLKDHRLARTSGDAEKLILAGRVKADGAPIGIGTIPIIDEQGKPATKDVVQRRIAATLRGSIEVVPA